MRHALLRALSRLACALAHLASKGTVREAKRSRFCIFLLFFAYFCLAVSYFSFGCVYLYGLIVALVSCVFIDTIVSHHSVRSASGRAVYGIP